MLTLVKTHFSPFATFIMFASISSASSGFFSKSKTISSSNHNGNTNSKQHLQVESFSEWFLRIKQNMHVNVKISYRFWNWTVFSYSKLVQKVLCSNITNSCIYQYFSRYAQNVPPKHILTKWNLQQLWQRTQCN